MADNLDEAWGREDIPSNARLYKRVPKAHIDEETGEINPVAFRDYEMSTDWEKYSTPQETRGRTARRPPEEYAVIGMIAGEIAKIDSQETVHSPDLATNNRAHTDVIGDKPARVRFLFLDIYSVEISLSDPV